MKRTSVCISAFVYMSAAARMLHAQIPAPELVRQYRDGEGARALEVAGYPCPADDSYREEVFRGLLALEQTPLRVRDLAGALRQALRVCPDPRLGAWYRLHVRTTTDTYAGLALGIALSEAPSPDNTAALKDAVLGEHLPEEVRGTMLAGAKSVSAEVQVAWLVEGHLMGRTIPLRHLLNRFEFGIEEEVAKNRARLLVLDAIVRRPDLAPTPNLISLITGDALAAGSTTAWRNQVRDALNEVAENSRPRPLLVRQRERRARRLHG